jgi:trigger factor
MSVQVEKLEHNMAKLTIEVEAEKLEAAMKQAYNKNKNNYNIPGFRRGKAKYEVVKKMFGPAAFYSDAADALLQEEYPKAVDECGEDVVSSPTVDIVQIEEGKPFIFTAEVALKPAVTLPEYKGIEVTKAELEVTDEDVEKELQKELENNARTVDVTDRAAANDDTVDIDFDGYCDGEQFDGGKSEGYSLKLGSGSFIDNFEDQIVGHNIGDEFDVNVTFPENYQATELAGKPAVFKVKLNGIKAKEIPAADDDFAQDVSEFDTLDEYKASLREKIAQMKADTAKRDQRDEAIQKIADGCEIDIPEAMIDTQTNSMINEIAQNLAQQGIPMSMYYQVTNTNEESLKAQYKGQAEQQIRVALALEAIAEAEGIEVTDEDINAELEKMAENYGMDPKTLLEIATDSDKENIRLDKKNEKAVDLVMESVVEVDAPAEEAAEETTEE